MKTTLPAAVANHTLAVKRDGRFTGSERLTILVQWWNNCVKQLYAVVEVRKLTLNHCRLLFNIH